MSAGAVAAAVATSVFTGVVLAIVWGVRRLLSLAFRHWRERRAARISDQVSHVIRRRA